MLGEAVVRREERRRRAEGTEADVEESARAGDGEALWAGVRAGTVGEWWRRSERPWLKASRALVA
jgi:hypothetical protein